MTPLKQYLTDKEFIGAVCHKVTPSLFTYRLFCSYRMRVVDLTGLLHKEFTEELKPYTELETFKDIGDMLAHDIRVRIDDIPQQVKDILSTSLEYTFFIDHLQTLLQGKYSEWYRSRVRLISFEYQGVRLL